MQNDNLQLPIWGRRSLPPNRESSIRFQFDPPPQPVVRTDANTAALIKAQKLHNKAEYKEAAELLVGLAQTDQLAKRLLLDCLGQLGNMAAIIDYFDPPAGATESIYLMDALWKEGKQDRLRQILEDPMIAKSSDPSVVETRNKYAVRLKK